MHSIVLLLASALVAVALAEGEYYVPRAYYTIDAEGHASAPVPLRRLRRSLIPLPYYPVYPGGYGSANANANANANAGADGSGGSNAKASANADASANGFGGWGLPNGIYGASNPGLLRAFQ